MTIHRFFVSEQSFRQNLVIIEDKDLIAQIAYVLRGRKGDLVVFLDNKGFEYESELISFSKNKISAKILNKKENLNEEKQEIVLYQAITKSLDKFELILQKCTELGVKAFVPVITERCQRDFLPKKERLEKIIKEAAEQSERGIVPELLEELNFESALKSAAENGGGVVCYERKLKIELKELKIRNKKINIFIGLEGGFSDKEIELVKSFGDKFRFMSLGKRILRTETAAIVAVVRILF